MGSLEGRNVDEYKPNYHMWELLPTSVGQLDDVPSYASAVNPNFRRLLADVVRSKPPADNQQQQPATTLFFNLKSDFSPTQQCLPCSVESDDIESLEEEIRDRRLVNALAPLIRLTWFVSLFPVGVKTEKERRLVLRDFSKAATARTMFVMLAVFAVFVLQAVSFGRMLISVVGSDAKSDGSDTYGRSNLTDPGNVTRPFFVDPSYRAHLSLVVPKSFGNGKNDHIEDELLQIMSYAPYIMNFVYFFTMTTLLLKYKCKYSAMIKEWSETELGYANRRVSRVVPFARRVYAFYFLIMASSFALMAYQYIENPTHCTLIAAQEEFAGTAWYWPLVVAQLVAFAYVLVCQTFFECNVIIFSYHLSNYFGILKDCIKFRLGIRDADVHKNIRFLEAQAISTEDILGKECSKKKGEVCFLRVWQKYENFAHLVDEFNGIFGPMVLLSYGLVLGVCLVLLYVPLKSFESLHTGNFTVFLITYISNFTFGITRQCVLNHYCSRVHEKSKVPYQTFNQLLSFHWPENSNYAQLQVFLMRMTSSNIGVSAWNFFLITKGTIFTFISLLVTYVILLLQTK